MKKSLVLVAIVLMAGATIAQAAPIIPFNTRQVTVGSTSDPASSCAVLGVADCQLQTLVNYLNPTATINVNTDQQTAGMWQLGGIAHTATGVLGLEIAGDASVNRLGIWSDSNGDTDLLGRQLVDIFNGSATGNNNGGLTSASLTFDLVAGTLTIGTVTGAPGMVNAGVFTGMINPFAFGFYLTNRAGTTMYSLDQLNGGSPQMLAFRDKDANRWTLGFEDTPYFGTSDKDFNDMLFQIESIQPVPEPGTMLLLGTGLFGLAGMLRRRVKK